MINMNSSKVELYDPHAVSNNYANGTASNLPLSSNSPSESESGGDDDQDVSTTRKRKRLSRPMNVTYVLAPLAPCYAAMHMLTHVGA